jgi:hypothetical protein
MDDHGRKTKEGHTMRYMATVFAVLVVSGTFGVPGLSADGGGDYSAPPPMEEDSVILADGGGDFGGLPVDERADEVRLADGGGDRSGLPGEEAPRSGLV